MPFGTSRGSKSVLKLSLKSSSASERHFGPLGAVLGSILGSFWGRLGLCFAVRRPNTKTLIFDDPLERNRVFSGPGGSKNQSKIGPESLLALELAPRASWRPLGLDFCTFLAPQNGPQRGQESKLKFEAFLNDFWSNNRRGRRQGRGPSGRGLLGSLPTVDAGFSKLCLSQCFRNPQVASLTASSEPERLSGRISSGPAAPNRPLSLRCFAHLSRSGRKRSFGK